MAAETDLPVTLVMDHVVFPHQMTVEYLALKNSGKLLFEICLPFIRSNPGSYMCDKQYVRLLRIRTEHQDGSWKRKILTLHMKV